MPTLFCVHSAQFSSSKEVDKENEEEEEELGEVELADRKLDAHRR